MIIVGAIARIAQIGSAKVFGWPCLHNNVTFPQTKHGDTTVACLECGKVMGYDWKEMRRKG